VHDDEGDCQPGTLRKRREHSKDEGTDSEQPNGNNLRFISRVAANRQKCTQKLPTKKWIARTRLARKLIFKTSAKMGEKKRINVPDFVLNNDNTSLQ
jgi:hypothetical protein